MQISCYAITKVEKLCSKRKKGVTWFYSNTKEIIFTRCCYSEIGRDDSVMGAIPQVACKTALYQIG